MPAEDRSAEAVSDRIVDGMSRQPSAATGTVMRPDTLRGYAESAGFTAMTILPIENFGFWRFYRLSAP